MDLPQELIDEIISHIPLDDENSLRNCSLVAKSWVYPSRRYLFWTIDIEGATRLKSWLANIPPTNIEILQHVRSIECQIADPPDSPRPLTDLLRDYSPSFRQFERLTFFMGFLPSLTQIGTYTAFQHTLSCLRLEYCSVTAIGLVALVNYFPNLARLDLIDLYRMADDQSTTPFSRPLQKLTIAEFFTDSSLALLDGLMGLRPQCEEVAISIYWALSPSLAQRVIDGVEASVKRVNLESDLEGARNSPKMKAMMVERNVGICCRNGKPSVPLELSRAPRAQDLCVLPGECRTEPHFIHHLHKHPKDNVHSTIPSPRITGIGPPRLDPTRQLFVPVS